MTDEKDLEIARLQGRLEAAQARPSAAVNTLKVLATLVGVLVVIGIILAGIGVANPPKTMSERLQLWEAQIAAKCDLKWTGSEKARDDCIVLERQTRPLPGA